ncbi:hypothetical protein DPMN_187870 [Dreissena polymorpha]|uniref:Uncharacterized protein n=1 Tax=Dreissena polymorpha TaxID=45954 RepID=A0A9D4I7Y0_DREPO|nr:hypothetical protein DPMN_187870 [Dreissena polymorpha]
MMSSTSSNTDFNTNAQFADAQVQNPPPNQPVTAQITCRQTVDSDLTQQAASAVVRDGFYISLTIILEFAASLAFYAALVATLEWRCVIQINGTVGAIELNERVSVIELNERVSVIELNERVSVIELNERVSVIELNERVSTIELNERVNAIELNEKVSAIELNSKMSFMELNWRGCVIHMNVRESTIELNGTDMDPEDIRVIILRQ